MFPILYRHQHTACSTGPICYYSFVLLVDLESPVYVTSRSMILIHGRTVGVECRAC